MNELAFHGSGYDCHVAWVTKAVTKNAATEAGHRAAGRFVPRDF